MQFSSHGQFEVTRTDFLIKASAMGAFNDEGARGYCEAIEQQVKCLEGQPYVIAVNLTRFDGATPGSWDILDAHNHYLAKTAIVAKAVIAQQAMIKAYAKEANEGVLRGKTQLFAAEAEALTWLRQRLAAHPSA